MKQKLFTLFLALITGTIAFAYDAAIGNIYYLLDSDTKTATVTYRGFYHDSFDEYSGSVVIPSSVTYKGTTYNVTSIGERAFSDCSSLTSITIPNSVTSIGYRAFYGCSKLTSPVYNAHCFAYMPTSYSGAYAIPEGIKQIAEVAFLECSSLTSVTIPNSVTSIGDAAFNKCTSLSSVYVESETPPRIGTYVFWYYDYSGSNHKPLDITIYVPCGTIETYRSAWSGYASRIAYSPINIEIKVNNEVAGEVVAPENMCDEMIVTAIPNRGYKFTKWSDGNTDNPRSLVLQEELSFTAIFDYALSGQCGKDSALTWTLDTTTMALNITGIGALSENYTYAPFIQSLTIGNSVTSIGEYAFSGCPSLTSVTIGNSVTSIGGSAFYECSSLTSITIPNSVTSIGNSAFRDCSSLTSITIPNSVTSIGEYTFYNCSSLTSITIPNSVTSIGYGAFCDCSSLTSITIPNSVTSIRDDAFYGCSNITSVTWNAKNCNTYNFGSQVTSFEFGNEVEVIPSSLCKGMEKLTSITIPNSVTSIGNQAFYGCSKLTSPVYNAHCFAYMPTSYSGAYTIPEGIKQIAGGAFAGCSSLNSVTVPESVTSIGKSAFEGCSAIDSIVWNAKNCADASASEDAPFYAIRSQITSFTFGENVEHIPAYLCDGMDKLTSVTIPNSVTSIGESAFFYCSSLTSVTIGESVTSIGVDAFEGCSSLTSVTIPNSVTSIGVGAFEGCSSLTSVTIPESVTSIGGGAFYGCSSLTSVTIPNSVTSIRSSAFRDCSSLTSITIPNSVTSIGDWAFYDCSSLTSVTIGNSVTSIGYYAFYGCSSLTSITCEAAIPPTIDDTYNVGDTYTFDGVSKSIPVYVPCGCVEAYKAASGWSDFTNIQEPLEYSIEVYVNDTIMGTAIVNYNTFCEGAQISATPNFGYHFVQWSDGNTDTIRTLVLTQDTTLIAEFAQSFSGQCGDSLYWELVDTTLHITGKGEMYDYEYNTIPWKLLVSSIKSLSVSEGTTSIGDAAFEDCSSLTSMTIPNSVTSIGKSVFEGCSSLTSVILTASSEEEFCIGQGNELLHSVDVYCNRKIQINDTAVTEFTIPNSVTSIGNYTFYSCSSLTSVTIPESVTSIGNYAFWGCTSLTSITIPNSVTSIGNYTFYSCSSLTSVTIPESVTSIGNWAFEGCSSLTSMTIPESVTSIGGSAFSGCSSLTSVTVGESVTSIGDSAFEGCSAIDSIVWNAKNCADASSLETAPFYAIRSQITSFTFGENVEHISAYLCDGMEKLSSVTIPNSVKTIGSSAFEGCARLGKISLGTGLEEIAANAFAGCTRLYDIYCHAVYPPFVDESSFANYNAYLYIPCDSKRDYTLDPVWGKFQHIECLSNEETDVENVDTSSQQQTNCQKIIRNGQLLILRDGKTYNAMGQEL